MIASLNKELGLAKDQQNAQEIAAQINSIYQQWFDLQPQRIAPHTRLMILG